MPCPHFKIKISTRSKSPPTTASAAYQSGERLYDERTHRTKDYNDKRGVSACYLAHELRNHRGMKAKFELLLDDLCSEAERRREKIPLLFMPQIVPMKAAA